MYHYCFHFLFDVNRLQQKDKEWISETLFFVLIPVYNKRNWVQIKPWMKYMTQDALE